MSDTITKWHEMQEEKILSDQGGEYYVPKKGAEPREIITADDSAKYIFVLDFTDGKAYRYDISALCTKENEWNPDTESCESFLYGAGHQIINCEWMITNEKRLINGN